MNEKLQHDFDSYPSDKPAPGEAEFPAPLESWSLADFADLIASGRGLS